MIGGNATRQIKLVFMVTQNKLKVPLVYIQLLRNSTNLDVLNK